MDIRTMQYYLAVVREGTISAAAQALHVAQPSLSRQMKELEEELGVTLFVRGNRKITLTEEGKALQEKAKEIPGKVAGCIDLPVEKAQQLYSLLYELLEKKRGKSK